MMLDSMPSRLRGRLAICGSLVVGMVLGVGVTAAFAAPVYSTWQQWTVYGTNYQTRAYIADDGNYGTQTRRVDGASSAAGYLGSYTAIYAGTTFCGGKGPEYNAAPKVVQITYQKQRTGPAVCVLPGYYSSKGLGYAYNPSTGLYVTKSTLNTPLKYL